MSRKEALEQKKALYESKNNEFESLKTRKQELESSSSFIDIPESNSFPSSSGHKYTYENTYTTGRVQVPDRADSEIKPIPNSLKEGEKDLVFKDNEVKCKDSCSIF